MHVMSKAVVDTFLLFPTFAGIERSTGVRRRLDLVKTRNKKLSRIPDDLISN
jgi:hypothetical protein